MGGLGLGALYKFTRRPAKVANINRSTDTSMATPKAARRPRLVGMPTDVAAVIGA